MTELSTSKRLFGHPAYACAILADRQGRLLLERRPVGARHAAGRLTCFGGFLRRGESALAGLRRELAEELGVVPRVLQAAVDLWVAGAWIARFFHAPVADATAWRRGRLGRGGVLLPLRALGQAPLSDWHAAALLAWRQRRASVRIGGRPS